MVFDALVERSGPNYYYYIIQEMFWNIKTDFIFYGLISTNLYL